MSEILETIMLIFFECSWPINLIKNYKCRSAEGMSIAFILLLILGYIAGIGAKIIARHINYVLLVYILNLIMVSANLIVYFRNRVLDRKKKVV
ncbi:MAG: PQ-loop repeat-containing protein [Ruminococcus sp.]|nr:PQ-loop repeat-containing protein [Ruminococcus sp.]